MLSYFGVDMAEETIFSKIIRREIEADIVFESETVLAFRDINPQAPVHILVIPKKHLVNIDDVSAADEQLIAQLFLAVRDIARKQNLVEAGYRVVVNNGGGAGQSVFHLHLHILGGRPFAWPPG